MVDAKLSEYTWNVELLDALPKLSIFCLINLPTIFCSTGPVTWRDNLQNKCLYHNGILRIIYQTTEKEEMECEGPCHPMHDVSSGLPCCQWVFPNKSICKSEIYFTHVDKRLAVKNMNKGCSPAEKVCICGTPFWYRWSNANALYALTHPRIHAFLKGNILLMLISCVIFSVTYIATHRYYGQCAKIEFPGHRLLIVLRRNSDMLFLTHALDTRFCTQTFIIQNLHESIQVCLLLRCAWRHISK